MPLAIGLTKGLREGGNSSIAPLTAGVAHVFIFDYKIDFSKFTLAKIIFQIHDKIFVTP